MAQILQRVIDWQNSKALMLSGESWMRVFPFGRGWSRLRIGFLATVGTDPVAAADSRGLTSPVTIDDIKLMCGVCTSTGVRDGIYNCKNVVGVNWVGSAAITTNTPLTLGGGFPTYYYATAGTPGAFVQGYEVPEGRRMIRFSSATQAGASTVSFGMDAPSTLPFTRRRCPFILDISRNAGGGGAVTMNVYYFTGQPTVDVTPAQLMDAIETAGTPSINNANLANASWSSNVFIGEAGGPLDTMFICGGRMAFPLYVYAIGAVIVTDGSPYDGAQNGGGWDWFQQYPSTGTFGATVPPGSYSGVTALNSGAGWAIGTSWIVNGTSAFYPVNAGLSGTNLGYPFDSFETYALSTANQSGSLSNTIINGGSGWGSPAVFNGTGQPGPKTGLVGTGALWPFDSFDTYVAGTISSASNLTPLNMGTGWTSPIWIY